MIREKALFCKLFHDKKSSFDRFNGYMAAYRPELETCPCCKCKGKCRIHAYYKRYILDFRKGTPYCQQIRVMRVMCECGHTHAILPDFIVPYCQLSVKYLLQILFAFYIRHKSIVQICQYYGITAERLYQLKNLFETHKQLWLGRMAAAEEKSADFIRSLVLEPDISGYLHDFYLLTSISFLQSHRNPTANSDGCELR